MPGGKWCPDCRAWMSDGTTCHECRRRRAWGTINRAIYESWTGRPGDILEVLEAVAMLMQERQALLHHHRQTMADEQRAAQRGSAEAYSTGLDEGRREGRDL